MTIIGILSSNIENMLNELIGIRIRLHPLISLAITFRCWNDGATHPHEGSSLSDHDSCRRTVDESSTGSAHCAFAGLFGL